MANKLHMSDVANQLISNQVKNSLKGDTVHPTITTGGVGPETAFRKNCKGINLHCSFWKPKNGQIRYVANLCYAYQWRLVTIWPGGAVLLIS